MTSSDGRVQRHEGAHVVAQLLEFPEQGPSHVGEPAGLSIRHDLRTQYAQLQWNHAMQSSKRTIVAAKNLVRSMAYCGTLGTADALAGNVPPDNNIRTVCDTLLVPTPDATSAD